MLRKSILLSLLTTLFTVEAPANEDQLKTIEKQEAKSVSQPYDESNGSIAEIQLIEMEARQSIGREML